MNAPVARVALQYRILVAGDVVDTNIPGDPEWVDVNASELPEPVLQALDSVEAGASIEVAISADDWAFGRPDPTLFHQFERREFDGMTLNEGALVSFEGPDNANLAGRVVELSQNHVIVNFNHPLQGHDVIYEIDVIDVELVKSKE